MDWNAKPPNLFQRVLGDPEPPLYGPSSPGLIPTFKAGSIGERVSAPIDRGLERLRQYGKNVGDLPRPLMMQAEDAIGRGADRATSGVRRLIQRYGTSPAPERPAPPKAPAWSMDPEDGDRSLGIAVMKPGGYY